MNDGGDKEEDDDDDDNNMIVMIAAMQEREGRKNIKKRSNKIKEVSKGRKRDGIGKGEEALKRKGEGD